jgi:hypothetical protein
MSDHNYMHPPVVVDLPAFSSDGCGFLGCQSSLLSLALALDSCLPETPVCLVKTESLLSTSAAALIACTYEDLRNF